MPSEKGQAAVAIPVPAAESVVSAWREQFDSSAAEGMPAHITVRFPFLPESRVTGEVVARLREMCSELPLLEVSPHLTLATGGDHGVLDDVEAGLRRSAAQHAAHGGVLVRLRRRALAATGAAAVSGSAPD